MFELSVQTSFSAAHWLRDYQGDCAKFHGHNWQVTVLFHGEQLNEIGVCMDFREIRAQVAILIDELDHCDLNQHPEFRNLNPTSETVARYLFQKLQEMFSAAPVHVHKVIVAENPHTSAAYFISP